MHPLKSLIFQNLQSDSRIWFTDDETKEIELNQTLLIDLVEKTDEKIINALLQNETLREKFFVKMPTPSQCDTPPKEGNTYVFKTRDFVFFLEENKVDNSFTDYKNRIGLTDGKRFLKDTTDVVLDFPYKDCVLEGGQSNEDGTDTYFEYDEKVTKTEEKKGFKAESYNQKQTKRKEIFFNSVLAQDEIDRLFDKKALINWKKFDKNGEHSFCHSELDSESTIQRDENGTIQDNLIIKGNNLLALHSLKSEFAGKVKLIYIDPPYNTGNDGFKYNDNFNHSTWLTFMKNRLEVAKTLLRDDGVIFVQCDDNEQAYLKVLMDEVFGRENFVANLVWKGRGGRQDTKFIAQIHETIICFSKNSNAFFVNKKVVKDESSYPFFDEIKKKKYKIQLIRKWGSNSRREDRPNLFFSVNFEGEEIFPILPDGSDGCWRWSKNKIENAIKNNLIVKETKKQKTELYEKIFETDGMKEITFSSWIDESFSGKAINHNKDLFGDKTFDYPKPEELIKIVLEISTQPNDIVLDYHLGSGTTCAVAHKMGRQYIGIEQMDYIEDIAVERLKKVIGTTPSQSDTPPEEGNYDKGGISKSVNWQGGGNFLYCELAEWNEKAKAEIFEQKDFASLKSFFGELYKKYFLNYNLKTKEFVEKTIQEENFAKLTLDEQKAIFIAMLDNNQMYVNQSEIDDEKYGVSESDKVMSGEFYNLRKE